MQDDKQPEFTLNLLASKYDIFNTQFRPVESSDDEIDDEKNSDISTLFSNKENRSPPRNAKLTESEKRRAESFLAWSPQVDNSSQNNKSELNDSELSLEPTPRSIYRKCQRLSTPLRKIVRRSRKSFKPPSAKVSREPSPHNSSSLSQADSFDDAVSQLPDNLFTEKNSTPPILKKVLIHESTPKATKRSESLSSISLNASDLEDISLNSDF